MNQPEKCCEKCQCGDYHHSPRHCANTDCPCHTQTAPSHEGAGGSITPKEVASSIPEKREKIERAAKDFSDRFTGVMKDLAEEEAVPTQSSGIEEIVAEFDFKFKHVHHPNIIAENIIRDPSEIHAWLRTTLTSFESRIRAEERERSALFLGEAHEAIKEAAAQERTRIADLIEGKKHENPIEGATPENCKLERRLGHNAALQTILNLIRGK